MQLDQCKDWPEHYNRHQTFITESIDMEWFAIFDHYALDAINRITGDCYSAEYLLFITLLSDYLQ